MGERRTADQDKSFIGDRSTVRGFSGDSKLIGSSGGYLRNTLTLERDMLQPYIGFDYGQLAKQQGTAAGWRERHWPAGESGAFCCGRFRRHADGQTRIAGE